MRQLTLSDEDVTIVCPTRLVGDITYVGEQCAVQLSMFSDDFTVLEGEGVFLTLEKAIQLRQWLSKAIARM